MSVPGKVLVGWVDFYKPGALVDEEHADMCGHDRHQAAADHREAPLQRPAQSPRCRRTHEHQEVYPRRNARPHYPGEHYQEQRYVLPCNFHVNKIQEFQLNTVILKILYENFQETFLGTKCK